jgi:hypothetical protein
VIDVRVWAIGGGAVSEEIQGIEEVEARWWTGGATSAMGSR